MTKEGLKEWFWNMYSSCYTIENDNGIDMCYDKNFIRQRKFARLLGKDIKIPTTVTNVIFHINLRNQYLYVDWNQIWVKFEQYGYKTYGGETESIIREILMEHDITLKPIVYF
jgi:hypothetical protein